ncbi:MAG: hypothetical protein VB074_00700 [Proteiniphilum sp.]|uniref:hypothetical protein n=1 Tax=Proteiniphilum sp. TaxID=1926877 RepID=UPI0009279D18|nr:hypothetical protein [Proteiniphilum sp.]MEA5126680.1 hypothetical protein [Proteiniphilum sp.]OJV88554.1 MAG: hypothetical protein BGO34_18185 [Bacteroidia bacterium 44-10]
MNTFLWNRNLVLIFVLSFWSALLICCYSQEQTTLPERITIQIYPEKERQTIHSIGGNYCQANYKGDAWDMVGEATLTEFKPTHVRVAIPLQFKGVNYNIYKGKKILKQSAVVSLIKAMRRMKDRYGVTSFTLSVWRVADELVENPEAYNKRRIKPEYYSEVIDMIEAFLLEMKKYGVDVDYFSFNESNGGYMTLFTAEETIDFIKLAGPRFENAGLKTKFLWGDTSSTKPTVGFASAIASDSTIVKYLGPLSFHSWWSENLPDSDFERIVDLAKKWDRPVWCTELGHDAVAHKAKDYNKNWDYAFRFAKISHRVFRYSMTEVSMFWTWQNNYEIMSADTEIKYPVYYVTRHQTRFLNNVRIVDSQSSDPEILPLAGFNKDNKLVLQIVNLKQVPEIVKLENIHDVSANVVTSTENNLWEEKTIPIQSGTIELKPQSVNTLVF